MTIYTLTKRQPNWVLRSLKKYKRTAQKKSTRIHMCAAYEAWHVSGVSVGIWRDKGEAKRWVKSSPQWRIDKGLAGSKGWELRLRKTQHSD